MDLKLGGKRALVTGSSKGIGEAVVAALAREEATVIVHGRDREQTEQVAGSIVAKGGAAHAVVGDLTNDDEVQNLVERAERLVGTIDIVVNNAGGSAGSTETWPNTSVAAWMAAYDRNVLGALRVTTRLLPNMQNAKWGRVINISSLAATMPPPSAPDYSASKAAMNAMTVSLAKAVALDGVTVNSISPGTILSPTLDVRFRAVAEERGLASRDAPWSEIERAVLPIFAQVPVGRVGRLEEIADLAAFLASPKADYLTGLNVRVDGGMMQSL